MIQYSPYMLATLLSAIVILIAGIFLLTVAVPRDPGLKNYRISCRFLAGAYIVLSVIRLWGLFWGGESHDRMITMAVTLIIASFQSLLFTASIITLINAQFITSRKVWNNARPMLLASFILFVVLFTARDSFYFVFYVMLGFYSLQLLYYISLFVQQYKKYHLRFDNFFSDNEYLRMLWIRNVFCIMSCIGVMALVALFVDTQVYMIFMIIYTVFYIYFAIKYINYQTQFYRIASVVSQPETAPSFNIGLSEEGIHQTITPWLESKLFLQPDVSLESLAKELKTNPSYLSRHINTTHGQNFRSWINSLRITEAQRIISEEDNECSLAEIGHRVGIASTSTFYRQFSAVTGMSPTEYRKKFGCNTETE